MQYPLRRLYGDDYRVAPLSVLVDPMRAARMLGLESGRSFSPKVLYVYEKQLEEADVIVINKSDLLTAGQREALERALSARFSQAAIVTVSARTGANLEEWFGRLSSPQASRPAMEVDYDVYAEGEALLGWMNATVRLSASTSVRWQPIPAASGRRRARPPGRRRHRDRAPEDDARTGYRQRPGGA